MAIYLVQHGRCLSKQEDPQKGLSDQGAAEVRCIAEVAAGYRVQVESIVHSGKKRALQTAEILSEIFDLKAGPAVADGINPLDDVAAFAATVNVTSNRMIVGHLPHLEKLAAYLITGKDQPPIFQLQNGGILCLDRYGESDRLVIKWALMPHVG